MKIKYTISIFLFVVFLTTVDAQPEINCDTIHTDPSQSEYVLPYPPGKTYTVTQSNCHPTGGHYLTFAYDFNTQMGDTIVASRSGIVTFANDQYEDTDWTSGHENNVFIGHSDGTRIRYTHLMKGGALVNVNEQVEQGQAIGISGNSGNTGGFPHLHLSAFQDNTSFNRQNTIPLNFCNTNDPFNNQNLLIEGQSYTAFDKSISSVDETEIAASISIHPNPVNALLKVEIKNPDFIVNNIQLLDITGKLIYIAEGIERTRKVEIPVHDFLDGVYFLYLKSEARSIVEKIIIASK